MIEGIGVGDNTNRIIRSNIAEYLWSFIQTTGVPDNITIVLSLSDDKFRNARSLFYSFAVTDCTIEFSHGLAYAASLKVKVHSVVEFAFRK